MEKGIKMLRRLLIFCLWLNGVSFSIFLVCSGVWGNYDGESWLPLVLPLSGVITFVVTFLLHIAVNLIFQKD
jgi:hypothetical protein